MLTNLDSVHASTVSERDETRPRKSRRHPKTESPAVLRHVPTFFQTLYAPLRRVLDVTLSLAILIVLGLIMVIRQWHFASETCEWFYQKGYFRKYLENTRLDVRLFENLIYGFYRRYPKRFLPICGIETVYHLLGIAEVWFILNRLSDVYPSLLDSFLLESVSRLIAILFKLVPLMIGVDEAGAQFVGSTVALAAGMGVTLAIIRKGRIFFWTAVGVILIIKRGLSIREISEAADG